jgi:Zn-dependent protease with chaperone function
LKLCTAARLRLAQLRLARTPAALILCILLSLLMSGCAGETRAEHAADLYASGEMAAAPRNGNLPDYSLPAAKLLQARQLASLRLGLETGGQVWGIVQLLLLIGLGAIAWMRDMALRAGRNRWLQAYVFLLLFLAARLLLNLPLSLYGHHLSLRYGLSIQRWPGWCADLGKSFALEWIIGGVLTMLLFATIRRFPRRWWLLFWVAVVPITLAGVYVAPLAIDPLFNQFEPLASSHPELARQLEHMGVPAGRQFLMKASAKVTTPNAYVTGLGASKRIVVWDTSLTANQPTPEVLWMVGHECGHYVLGHVLEGTLLTLAGLLPLLYLGYRFVNALISRFGAQVGIVSAADWGALAVLLLAVSLIGALTEPISNTISRHIEHDADIYGEEAIHGLVPDPQAAVRSACDSDGLRTLDVPNPGPLVEFWTYNHPATGRRAAFGVSYNPWAPGMQPKYFRK